MCTSTVWAFLRRFFRNYEFTALITVISRNSVSPPDLTGDTPVFDVLKPVKVNLVKTLRYETKFTSLQCVIQPDLIIFSLELINILATPEVT